MSAFSHYDIIRRPVITEKSTKVSEHNKVIFVVAEHRHQARDQGCRRGAVQGQGDRGQHAQPQGQAEAVPQHAGPPVGHQACRRHPGRRPDDRRDDRAVRESWSSHGTEEIQADHARPAPAGHRRPVGSLQGQAGQGAGRGQAFVRRAQQLRPGHRALARRRPQARLPAASTSSGASSTSRRRSSGWNTIPTAPPSSRSSSMPMASFPTSWRRSASASATPSSRPCAPT